MIWIGWYAERAKKTMFYCDFFFPSSDNDGKDRESSLVANDNGKVLKLLWNTTWMWNQHIVVTERSHVILPIYRENYQFWGIEGISSVHLIYVPYFFKRNVVVLPWWPDELHHNYSLVPLHQRGGRGKSRRGESMMGKEKAHRLRKG